MSGSRSGRERPLQLFEGWLLTAGHHLHRAVRTVSRIAPEPQPSGLLQDEPPEADTLHPTRHDVAPCDHAASRRRFRSSSTKTGTTDSAMMARMTSVKLERTAGMLPKKYPPSTNSDTQSTAPARLYARKRG